MDRHIIILTTDKRQEALGELLPGRKKRVDREGYERKEISERIYVLPTPVRKLDAYPEAKERLMEELQHCKGPVRIFLGAITPEWRCFLEENGIPFWDFMALPEVVRGNAVITAEATLALAVEKGDYSILGQRILITGYGACGKEIARVFAALKAEVVVAVRRSEARREVEEDGYQCVDLSELPYLAKGVQMVINTVPAPVITREALLALPKEALVIDIASAPGGCDFAEAKKLGKEAFLAGGLPGLYTTKSSAALMAAAIGTYAPQPKEIGEEQVWIYQVIM